MIRARLRRRRAESQGATVSLTPLIDTALTLLVVFMVTAPVARHVIQVELPRAATEDQVASAPRELIIIIDKANQIFLDGAALERDELLTKVTQLAQITPVVIFLRIDKKVAYGSAIELLALLRTIEGVQSVAFDIDLDTKTF